MKRWWKRVIVALVIATLACSSSDQVDDRGDTHTTVEVCGAAILPLILITWRWL